MDVEAMQARLKELQLARQGLSVRAGQLQAEYDRAIVQVHELDGAIGMLSELIPKGEPRG